MVNEESLKQKYSEMDTTDLLEIAKNKTTYTELANSVALRELKSRKIEPEVIAQYEPILNKINDITKQNSRVDLSISHKLLYFYIMWFPKARHYYSPDFSSNGYMLKDNQSNYYSFSGFGSLVATIVLINFLNEATLFAFLITWTLCFLLIYLFDINYNRQRQIDNIKKILDKDEIPWGFY